MDDRPQLDLKTHTISQFVADFFGRTDPGFDYSVDLAGECWNGYVSIVAAAGAVLEDVVQSRIGSGRELAVWYDVLEDATDELRKQMLAAKGWPGTGELTKAFEVIVDRHLEV